jgi:Domain of unknown function (DUF4337)
MPEDVEVETEKLQEQVDEAREQLAERTPRWVRYVGLGAAFFAVLAAVSALRAADLINEALINQIKASDTWNEYQAAREKEHAYALAADNLSEHAFRNVRLLSSYRAEIASEAGKEKPLQSRARDLEEESAAQVRRHQAFENAVALLQVGIALGAVAALARSMPAWYVSLAAGLAGFIFFLKGFLT